MDEKKEAVAKVEPATPIKAVVNTSANGGSAGIVESVGGGTENNRNSSGSNTAGGGHTSGGGGQGFRRGGGGGGGGRFFGNQRGGSGGSTGGDRGGSGGGRGPMRGSGGNNFDDNRRGGGGGGGRFQMRDGGNSGGGGGGGNQQRDHNRHQQNHNNQRDDDHMGGGGGGGGRNLDRQVHDKLMEMAGPTYELPPLDIAEKKFSGRARLYIGNIPPDISEDELTEKFKKYGEVSEVFLNREKNFGFIRLDYHCNAERAKNELNGTVIKNRTLKIRFAPNGSMLKVKNLDEQVTNELLHLGFSAFGDIDRAVVVLDDRGKPTGEGLVEFSRKNAALFAVRKCTEGCFFLTKNIRPVLVELYEATDENDGYSDRFANKKHPDYMKNRSMGPRMAPKDSFEHDYGMRWKQLYELHKQKMQALNKELEIDQNKLIAQMEYARYEHETAMLREQLRAREMDMDRQKREWEMKQQQAEDDRRRSDELMRRQEEEIQSRMQHQEEEMRRRQQENNLFLQAQQLNNMLEHQEQVYAGSGGVGGGAGGKVGVGGGGPGDMDSNLFSEVNMDSVMDQKQGGGFGNKGGYVDRMGGGGGGSNDRMGGGGNKPRGGYGGGGGGNDRNDRNDGGGMRGMVGGNQHNRGGSGAGVGGGGGSTRGGGGGGGGGGDPGSGGNFWASNNDNYGHNKRRRF